MRNQGILLVACFVFMGAAPAAKGADEDAFLRQIHPPQEQAVGYGRSAIWTLPLVATQYQPARPAPAMEAALQAQRDGRFLDAMIQLDDARKGAGGGAELDLLRASFLLQGNQPRQALETLAPLQSGQHAADAYALAAMAHLQQGQMQQALEAAQHAQAQGDGMLAPMALSYALQGTGRLSDARDVMHRYNAGASRSAVTLAREAELALTLDQVPAARTLSAEARGVDAQQPYVVAVGGLVDLIDGRAHEAKAGFEAALRRDPQDAKALLGLGLAEIRLGNVKAGEDKLLAANEADPNNALVLTYLGRAQQQLGQTEAARASWRAAQQADPKDPMPWLYQARADLQAGRPAEARESLREAQERLANRSVYRGERLLKEDQQLLQANLAEAQRQQGLDSLAFHTLADPAGEKNSASLRNQADLLQGQRFAESARRSLLLQSQFGARPGTLPSDLDIFGDGAGQTGAAVPQHGVVSDLGAQQASYNNYDDLFSPRATIAADATTGGKGTEEQQVRLGAGGDTVGVGLAERHYRTNGFGIYNNLDNSLWQGIAQWRPGESTEVFALHQNVYSLHGEIVCPADPVNCGVAHQYLDNSSISRVGLRQSLDDNSELRALVSRQQTSQTDNWEWTSDFAAPPVYTVPMPGISSGTWYNSSETRSEELQYRRGGAGYALQMGVSSARAPLFVQAFNTPPLTNVAQQVYVNWQGALSPRWQLEAGLAWGKNDKLWTIGNTYLRRWLPRAGLVYTPDALTHLRLAAWKNLDDAAVGNASLAPATLAGIALNRPGDIFKLVRGVALGGDRQLSAAWLLEGQGQRRWRDDPYAINFSYQGMTPSHIDDSRLALHWQPGDQSFNLTLAYDDEYVWNDPTNIWPNSVRTQHLRSEQLGLRWLADSQWTVNLNWSRNLLNAVQQSTDLGFNPILLDVRDRFNQADASLTWQFSRIGTADFGVRNATNRAVLYTETDPLIPRFSQGRLGYARLRLLW